VKSVTGYDVPKLMVGALGTLGVLAELTLRLHARPEVERTWLVPLHTSSAAESLTGAILDSSLQPNRIELMNRHALGGGAPALALLVSFGSVEEAVAEQGERLARLARDAGGEARAVAGQWTTAAANDGARTSLRIGSLPGRLASTYDLLTRALTAAGVAQSAISAHAGLGVWHVVVDRATPETVTALVPPLREAIADHGGYVAITGAPVEIRRRVDPWGAIAPDAFALMQSIKTTFDPERRLNPGRFVQGL
jgi:glycolate oxidase FAD binding subunit